MGDKTGRGALTLDQFVEWANAHVVSAIPKIPTGDVGLYHVEDYSEEQYIGFVEKAVNNPGSYEHASFYNFILNCFVETDEQCQGTGYVTARTFWEWTVVHVRGMIELQKAGKGWR